MSISSSGDGYSLSIAGWHDEFPSLAAVERVVSLVLVGTIRVRVELLGTRPRQYRLQRLSSDRWEDLDVIVFPRLALWWLKRSVVLICNEPHSTAAASA